MCATWTLRNKISHIFYIGTSPLVLSVQFSIMKNFANFQLLPMMKFSFNTLPCYFLLAPLLKCVSDFTTDIFSSEKELFSGKTPRTTEMYQKCLYTYLFSSYRWKQNTAKIISNFFLPEEAGAFRNNMKSKRKSHTQKLKKMSLLYIYRDYLFCLQSNASGNFLQDCTILQNNDSNFLTLKVT